jgi:hypothetical protein
MRATMTAAETDQRGPVYDLIPNKDPSSAHRWGDCFLNRKGHKERKEHRGRGKGMRTSPPFAFFANFAVNLPASEKK